MLWAIGPVPQPGGVGGEAAPEGIDLGSTICDTVLDWSQGWHSRHLGYTGKRWLRHSSSEPSPPSPVGDECPVIAAIWRRGPAGNRGAAHFRRRDDGTGALPARRQRTTHSGRAVQRGLGHTHGVRIRPSSKNGCPGFSIGYPPAHEIAQALVLADTRWMKLDIPFLAGMDGYARHECGRDHAVGSVA